MAFFQADIDITSSYDLGIDTEDRHDKLAKERIKTIIENKMGNRMISTRPFTSGGQ